ncbi:MAG: P-loop NTPase [Rhodothermales bacterium]|nr:P-loop NTPase [Rhodothermales bacterium]MBO6780745.1 P-loop NTPase [Rhodothermales bacterium]
MTQTAPPAENKVLVRHVVQTGLRGKWILVASLLLFIGLAVAYLYWKEPVFRAETTVIIDSDAGGEVMGLPVGAYQDVLVEVEILESLDLAKRVAATMLEDLGAGGIEAPRADWPAVVAASDPVLTQVALAQELQDRIDVEQARREVGVVRIFARSEFPREAQYIANAYAAEYAARNLERAREQATGVRSFLEGQIDSRQADLTEAEEELRDYQEREGAIALDEEVAALTRRMADTQARRDQAAVELQVVQSELASLRRQVEEIEPNLYERVASGVENEIVALQREIAEREALVELRYARNPELRGNEQTVPEFAREIREIEALRTEVSMRARRLVDEVLATGGLDPDMARRLGDGAGLTGALANVSRLRQQIADKTIEASGLRARIRVLDSRIGRDQQEFNRIPRQSVALAGLERARRSQELTYDWLQERYQEARIAEASEFGTVRVLDVAELPDEPVEPRPIYILALATLLGLAVGLTGVFGREVVDERLRQPDELRRLGVPVAGVIPDLKRVSGERRRMRSATAPEVVTITAPQSAAADAFARVAMSVEMGSNGRPVQTVLVTSGTNGDGKSVVASNMAVTMAAAGHRTLLLDLNAWNPSAHRMLGTPAVPGVSNVLYEGRLVRESVHGTDVDGLYVLPLGDIDVSNGHFLASPDLRAMVGYLRKSFSRIVIDAGPLLTAGRTVALSHLADAVLVVLRAGETQQADLREAMDLLDQARAGNTYAVLNGFNARQAYGYFNDRSYYGRFGSGREKRLGPAAGRAVMRSRPAPFRPVFQNGNGGAHAAPQPGAPAQAGIYRPA